MPGLRRLRHPAGRPAADARARRGPREHGVRLGHRLLQPVPVLHEHLRDALDPRPGPGDRHRRGGRPPRPRRVGHHRRRRRPVDRRQPPHPRPATQRQPDDPAVQQPDLRPDQGPVLAHVGDRQGHQVHADGLGRSAVQPAGRRPRRRGQLRRPHPRPRPQAHDGDVPGRPRPPRGVVRRDLPELQRLQRRRVRRRHQAAGPRRDDDRPRARPADPLRRRGTAGCGDGHRRAAADRRGGRRRRGRHPRPRCPSRRSGPGLRAVPAAPDEHSPTPFGVFRDVERPEYGIGRQRQLAQASERKGPGDLAALLRCNGTWSVDGTN